MSILEKEHIFTGKKEKVFLGLKNFELYPEYLPGVTKIEVLSPAVEGAFCQVKYELKLIKSFHYTLNMFEEKKSRLYWNLESSNILKKSNGSWDLKAVRGKEQTKALYTVEVTFRGLVPQKIVDKVTTANIPALFSGFQQIIDQ